MYLLDTNVVSELRKAKSGRADPNVIAWAQPIPVASLFLSAITVLEPDDITLTRIRHWRGSCGIRWV